MFSSALNFTKPSNAFRVPSTETTITFTNWAKLLYQTDVDLCLLEAMGDVAAAAINSERGDKAVVGNRFRKSYGKATISMDSYSPPAFRLTMVVLMDTLRGLGLYLSLYGYFEVDFDIFHQMLGHVGIGTVQYSNQLTG